MLTYVIVIAAFIGVSALIFGVASVFRDRPMDVLEDRLEILAGVSSHGGGKVKVPASLLAGPLDDVPGALERFFSRVGNVRRLLDQADVDMAPAKFLMICVAAAAIGGVLPTVAGISYFGAPFCAAFFGFLPVGWVMMKRKKRLKAFAAQMPEALELVARALRAGHSLGSGLQMVGDEMSDPIAEEFIRVFEEQNLGVPLDEALKGVAERVPNMDLMFFVTAVILQRQTGGDLAEILDKIGSLVRERFKIMGAIQSLTGEGRLSGVVLLAMPPVLLGVMFYLNYDYAMMLFTDPLGKKMLFGACIMQFVGALVIRKIVNIKV